MKIQEVRLQALSDWIFHVRTREVHDVCETDACEHRLLSRRDIVKNIVLFALNSSVVEAVLTQTDWHIQALILPNDMYKERYSDEPRIQYVYTRYDFHRNNDLAGLDFKELEQFRGAQLHAENFFLRFINDYQMAKYDYYRGFALVSRIFRDKPIDLVIVDGFNEGRASDMLLTEFAKYKGIPTYNLDVVFTGKSCVYDNIKDRMMSVYSEDDSEKKEKDFYSLNFNTLTDSVVFYHPILKNKFAQMVERIVYVIFGQVGVDACSCLYTMSNRKNKMGLKFTERFQLFLKARRIKKWLDRHTQEADVKEKYIYFSLHYEPEATVSARGLMESQIVALRILSQLLPEGWKLYVKEHPHQFKYNERMLYAYPLATFKSIRFYEEILAIPNVVLLHTKLPSDILIRNSQAVASLSGTAFGEAVAMKKPILLFAGQRTPYRILQESYNIRSYADCVSAIHEVRANSEDGRHPDYRDWDGIFQRYLFETSPEGYKEAVAAINRFVGS